MDWNKLKAFYEVAINKSISKASIRLNISQSAISRQIQDLELDLKTPLFIRHQKGVRLTEQGENLFNAVSNINFSISDFEKKLIDKKTKPVGKLTINSTVGFGSTWLTPRINKFAEKFPDIDPQWISFPDLHKKIIELDNFIGDPNKSNEKILEAIQQSWIDEFI